MSIKDTSVTTELTTSPTQKNNAFSDRAKIVKPNHRFFGAMPEEQPRVLVCNPSDYSTASSANCCTIL